MSCWTYLHLLNTQPLTTNANGEQDYCPVFEWHTLPKALQIKFTLSEGLFERKEIKTRVLGRYKYSLSPQSFTHYHSDSKLSPQIPILPTKQKPAPIFLRSHTSPLWRPLPLWLKMVAQMKMVSGPLCFSVSLSSSSTPQKHTGSENW